MTKESVNDSLNSEWETPVGATPSKYQKQRVNQSTNTNSAATLLDKADIALYKAKETGRNCFFIYQSGMASEVFAKAATAENLKNLIEAGETSLYLQPIARLSSDQKIVGYEALFRCPNLTKSIQYLISCAEKAGIIHLVTESILDGIQIELNSNNYEKDTYVSVNISPVQFLEFDFPSKFLHQLQTRKIDPQKICIEITETAVLDDTSRALDHMNSLKMAGVNFSLDDFGTGYSSIELLRKLPFTSIKIDRSYIQNIDQDSGMKLVKSIINMAKAFNMELIGEGVETVGQKTPSILSDASVHKAICSTTVANVRRPTDYNMTKQYCIYF